jgi:hypothetical protein
VSRLLGLRLKDLRKRAGLTQAHDVILLFVNAGHKGELG